MTALSVSQVEDEQEVKLRMVKLINAPFCSRETATCLLLLPPVLVQCTGLHLGFGGLSRQPCGRMGEIILEAQSLYFPKP